MIVKPGYAGIVYEVDRNTIIADIGFGHDPVRGATYYIDRDNGESDDRGGRTAEEVPPEKFIQADVTKGIPLGDKSCDLVIASHIIEHIPDPESFCKEMSRIGKAGYIEAPGIVQEIIQNRSVHLWYVTKFRGVIYLIRKPDWLLIDYQIPQHFPIKVLSYLFRQTCYHWVGVIRVKVIG